MSARVLTSSILLGALLATACNGTSSLPTPTEFARTHSPFEEGVPLYLTVDFAVGRGFRGEVARVVIDGDLVLQGFGNHRPSLHCNWYGPYEIKLEPGEHEVEFSVGEGVTLTEMFSLSQPSSALALYIDPSADGDVGHPRLDWHVSEGQIACE